MALSNYEMDESHIFLAKLQEKVAFLDRTVEDLNFRLLIIEDSKTIQPSEETTE